MQYLELWGKVKLHIFPINHLNSFARFYSSKILSNITLTNVFIEDGTYEVYKKNDFGKVQIND